MANVLRVDTMHVAVVHQAAVDVWCVLCTFTACGGMDAARLACFPCALASARLADLRKTWGTYPPMQRPGPLGALSSACS